MISACCHTVVLSDLTLPAGVQEWHLDAVRDLLAHDRTGVLNEAISKMDSNGELLGRPETHASFFMKYIAAPISPVLGVSNLCFNQSLVYLASIFVEPKSWAYLSRPYLIFIARVLLFDSLLSLPS